MRRLRDCAPGRNVAPVVFDGLYALQHRGQESAGMAVSDGSTMMVDEGHGPGDPGLQRLQDRQPGRAPGHWPYPLFDYGVVFVAQRPADVPPGGRDRVRRRPQRQPHQYRGAGGVDRDAAGDGNERLGPDRRAGRPRAGPRRRRRSPNGTASLVERSGSGVAADGGGLLTRPGRPGAPGGRAGPERFSAAVPRASWTMGGSWPPRHRRSISPAPISCGRWSPARCS